jgi:hypothetical protein
MKSKVKKLRGLAAWLDVLIWPLLLPCAVVCKTVRRIGLQHLPRCRRLLLKLGVFPIRDHYYEPQFDHRAPRRPLDEDRPLPGIDWNLSGQLAFLESLNYAEEIWALPPRRVGEVGFDFINPSFRSGDAEFWYQLIRHLKPRRIKEIGSGHSTLLAALALARNRAEDEHYRCDHVCVEPYEAPWLEAQGVTVIRKKVEDLSPEVFADLERNDILFIDSSHMIRPEGDVLFEYLELLPTLRSGVVVHIHDIFSPRNYPADWLQKNVCFWNEQYLLEAFLSHNHEWRILGALNYLCHHHYDALKRVAPHMEPEREPGSFYIQRV